MVEGDAIELAKRAAARINGSLLVHERFRTATVSADGFSFDIASARKETYARPGALPDVELGATIAEDLARRDFTVNAIALDIARDRAIEWPGARAGRRAPDACKVLHERSFIDDPTRMLRLVRYAARLAFNTDEKTARADRPAPDGHGDRRPARQRAAARALRTARRFGTARAHRPRRAPDRPRVRGRRLRPAGPAGARRVLHEGPARAAHAAPRPSRLPRQRTPRDRRRRVALRSACTPSSTSRTPSCGGFCTASASRRSSCSPPRTTTAPSAGWTTCATAGSRSPAPT